MIGKVVRTAPKGRRGWASRIRRSWRESLEAVLATGQLLIDAKAALPHGSFAAMIEGDLPFGPRAAQRLMKIAGADHLANATHVSLLPPAWSTLYELARLPAEAFEAAAEAGKIRPDMERNEAALLNTAERRVERLERVERLAAAKPPDLESYEGAPAALGQPRFARRFPVLYMDPAWKTDAWSEAGLVKSPEANHYPTMTFEELAALPVGALAADDAALWCWATMPHLAQCFELIKIWGFAYKSHLVWRKATMQGALDGDELLGVGRAGQANPGRDPPLKRGTGHWFIGVHEVLLLATRGNVPAPLKGTQAESEITAPWTGKHSEKPAVFRALIEAYFPDVAKLELFCRGAPAPGWHGWGKECVQGSGDRGQVSEGAPAVSEEGEAA